MRLSWYELVPIISFLTLRGRCQSCGAHVPSRYLFVELLTGLLYISVAQVFYFDLIALVLNMVIVALLVVILLYDIRHLIIPDTLVMYLMAVACAYVFWDPFAGMVIVPAYTTLIGALIPASFFALLWCISRGRWIGLGDAKLAIPLGLIVGMGGSVSLVMLAFWIGAVASLSLLGIQRIVRNRFFRRVYGGGQLSLLFFTIPITIKSEVPFAPFLIGAFFLVHLFQVDAVALITYVTTMLVG